VRAPIPTGSLVDLTIEAQRATTADEINAAFAEHAGTGELAGILAYSEEPLVSSDIVKSPYSSIFDAPLTSVVDGTLVKVIAWYDNEWGYSNRLVELAQLVLAPVLAGMHRER
jgi:glyceraldehyde 3-phosphate dehydrogenase